MVFVWMYKRARFSWWEGTIWMGVFIVQITQPFPMYQRSIVWWDVMLPTQLNYSIGPCPFYGIITLLHFKYRYTYYYYSSKLTLIESTYIDLPDNIWQLIINALRFLFVFPPEFIKWFMHDCTHLVSFWIYWWRH